MIREAKTRTMERLPGDIAVESAQTAIRIAVIIPFFNDMEKLARAVDSLLGQTLPPSHIVLVDDLGGERLDEGIQKRIAASNTELLLVVNEVNLGPGGSRQAGMEALKGHFDFIMYLDSDDYLAYDCLKALTDVLLQYPELAAAYAETIDIYTGATRIHPGKKAYDNLVDGMLVGPRGWGTGSLLWRYPIVRNIQWPSIRRIEDSHFELSVALVNPRIRYVREARIFIDQTWEAERLKKRNRHVAEPDRLRLVQLYERILYEYPLDSIEARKKGYLRQAVYCWMRKSDISTIEYLKKAFSFVRIGRWKVTVAMLFYLPKYVVDTRTTKGS